MQLRFVNAFRDGTVPVRRGVPGERETRRVGFQFLLRRVLPRIQHRQGRGASSRSAGVGWGYVLESVNRGDAGCERFSVGKASGFDRGSRRSLIRSRRGRGVVWEQEKRSVRVRIRSGWGAVSVRESAR